MMRPNLVILSDNFGLNFSGAAIATCRIFKVLENEFNEIIVIGKQLGFHPFQTIRFLKYKNRREAVQHIRRLDAPQTIFYGDFYMTYYFIIAKVPFYFTYHDNWPEQRQFGWRNALWAFYYLPVYRWIIRKANWTITVSEFKYNFISKISQKTSIIRNGINVPLTKKQLKKHQRGEAFRVLMSGNIDDRKFAWALPLFQRIQAEGNSQQLKFHIFGKSLDAQLAKQLQQFDFVQLEGFQLNIDFLNFDLYCCTSKIENLSIAVCEALCNFTPVLSFDVGGLKEVIAHKETGILIEEGQIEAYYQALVQIVKGQIKFDFSRQDLSAYDWSVAAQAYRAVLMN